MATFSHKISTIYRCGSMYRTAHSAEKLPGIYHGYISLIHNRPGQSQDEIAKYLCLSKSSATRHLAYLEENGYIERRKNEADKREMLVYPTEKLEAVVPEIFAISTNWHQTLTDGIGEEEYALFIDILERLSERAQKIIYGGEDAQ